jgi:peptidoglycan/xylan/chitin deacetylase (PgdA/CDA1 family)
MSLDDLKHLHAKGFGIGGHSVTHPILSRCTPKQAYEEIAGAKEQLEALVNGKVTSFAYPNGMPGIDFDLSHVEMVRRAGYLCAVTTHRGFANINTSMLQIPRFTPWGPTARRMDFQFLRNFMTRAPML